MADTGTITENKITVALNSSNGDLRQLFNQMRKVYYNSTAIENDDFSSGVDCEMEFPVIEGGVNFNGPTTDKQEIKLTDGTIWTQKVTLGDSDISLQIASIADKIASLFMTKKTTGGVSVKSKLGTNEEITYNGVGYVMDGRVVKGALVMYDQSGETMIVLPNVEMSAAINGADGDNPAYFDTKVTPLINKLGVNIYIFQKA